MSTNSSFNTGKKEGMESQNVIESQKNGNSMHFEYVPLTDSVVSEAVILGAREQVSEVVSKSVAETQGHTSSSQTTGLQDAAQRKKQKSKELIQLQVQKVQQMQEKQLITGIKQIIREEIHVLEKQARKIERSFLSFSAYELNQMLVKIRKLKKDMIELMTYSLEKLRELYIKIVLKLQAVPLDTPVN